MTKINELIAYANEVDLNDEISKLIPYINRFYYASIEGGYQSIAELLFEWHKHNNNCDDDYKYFDGQIELTLEGSYYIILDVSNNNYHSVTLSKVIRDATMGSTQISIDEYVNKRTIINKLETFLTELN